MFNNGVNSDQIQVVQVASLLYSSLIEFVFYMNLIELN